MSPGDQILAQALLAVAECKILKLWEVRQDILGLKCRQFSWCISHLFHEVRDLAAWMLNRDQKRKQGGVGMRGRSGWGWGFIPGKTDTNSYPFQEDKHFLSVQTLYKSRSKRSINCLNGLHVGLKKISIYLNSLPISVRKNLVSIQTNATSFWTLKMSVRTIFTKMINDFVT